MTAAPEATLAERFEALRAADLHARHGRVTNLIGLIVEATGVEAEVGELCHVESGRDSDGVPAEVVGFRDARTLLMPLGEMHGIGPGRKVSATGRQLGIPIGPELLGRVVDALGRPIDGGDDVSTCESERPTTARPPGPLERPMIRERVSLGVRALDALVPCGRGQRLGIFAGSGVGKSSLLGMIARSTSADVNVICLVGERGREVREFIDSSLGSARARSVVVVSTSDEPALLRIKAAFTATAIAEYFRDEGLDVTLMMDSVTRFAMAQREVGLAIGEPPATRGYTPSVFALLPKLLERSGTSARGSITGLYTVLVDGDDMNEPIADAVRAILDGHVVLSRQLAHQNHYPAIDVLHSVSRLTTQIMAPDLRAAGAEVRKLLAALRDKGDLISIGAYQRGTDMTVDTALDRRDAMERFLRQPVEHCSTLEEADAGLLSLVSDLPGDEAPPATVEEAEGDLPSVAPGPSALPPLNLPV